MEYLHTAIGLPPGSLMRAAYVHKHFLHNFNHKGMSLAYRQCDRIRKGLGL